jgi:hypothetical protein
MSHPSGDLGSVVPALGEGIFHARSARALEPHRPARCPGNALAFNDDRLRRNAVRLRGARADEHFSHRHHLNRNRGNSPEQPERVFRFLADALS